MAVFQFRSASEQVVDFLKGEIAAGRWGAAMPGGDRLSKELGVGKARSRRRWPLWKNRVT